MQLAPEHAVAKAFALEDDGLRGKIEGLLAEQQKARGAMRWVRLKSMA